MQFEPNTNPPCYQSEDSVQRITKDDTIRFKVVGTRIDGTEIVCNPLILQFVIGSIKEDFLGHADPGIQFPSLQKVESFEAIHSNAPSSIVPYGVNEFSAGLTSRTGSSSSYEIDLNADERKKVQGEIEQVRNVIVQNIQEILQKVEKIEKIKEILQRVERIENLVDKIDSSRRKMWRKNAKLMIMLVLLIFVLIYFFICIPCGFPDWTGCKPQQ